MQANSIIPVGFCQCGCGQKTNLATHTRPSYRKGQPVRFIYGHGGSTPKPRPPQERFWTKVDRNGPIPEHCPELGPCWLWTGSKKVRGYGCLRSGKPANKILSTHRLSWEIHYGPIPDGFGVCHHCDNPPCVRPDHFFLGTQVENMADAGRKGHMKKKRRVMDSSSETSESHLYRQHN